MFGDIEEMTTDKLNWMIHDLVLQGCHVENKEGYDLDSGFIRIYADALDYLEEIGFVRILQDKSDRYHRARQAIDLKNWYNPISIPPEPKS
jgi:hypothetical protein